MTFAHIVIKPYSHSNCSLWIGVIQHCDEVGMHIPDTPGIVFQGAQNIVYLFLDEFQKVALYHLQHFFFAVHTDSRGT